jgi:hypothetical protein
VLGRKDPLFLLGVGGWFFYAGRGFAQIVHRARLNLVQRRIAVAARDEIFAGLRNLDLFRPLAVV